MPRFRVVAAVVLALALMVASCSDSADQSEVADRQQQLEEAHKDGEKAHKSMARYGLKATESECKAHYNATVGEGLGSDDMVDLGRHYFVTGCMEELDATGVAQGP
jgi:hypothetical protein